MIAGLAMSPLEKEITTHGRVLRQRKREGRIAIYELLGAGNVLYGYEVIIIKFRKAREAFGKQYPDMEAYPSNEDWGKLAWSYGRNDLKLAMERFDGLIASSAHAPHSEDLVNDSIDAAVLG